MCKIFKYLMCCDCFRRTTSSAMAKKYNPQESAYEGMQSEAYKAFKIEDQELPKEYKVPSEKYGSNNDVLRECGYDPSSERLLHRTQFSEVLDIIRIKDGVRVAIKKISIKGMDRDRDKKKIKTLKTELAIMSIIKHKNIVSLFDTFLINNFCYIFMELAVDGSVETEMDATQQGLSEEMAKKYFLQICKAVNRLHNGKIKVAHQDIKLGNVLIFRQNGQKVLKLADFGLSHVLSEKHSGKAEGNAVGRSGRAVGTKPYMSPQMIRLSLFNQWMGDEKALKAKMGAVHDVNVIKADIWSLGVCLYFMIKYEYPFTELLDENLNMDQLLAIVDKQTRKDFESISIGRHMGCFSCMDYLTDLMNSLLEPKTSRRIVIENVLKHEWLSNVSEVIPLPTTKTTNI